MKEGEEGLVRARGQAELQQNSVFLTGQGIAIMNSQKQWLPAQDWQSKL